MTSPDTAVLPDVARRMREHADRDCVEACRWYHAIWTHMRLFSPKTKRHWDRDLLLDALEGEARNGARSVLVSGSADTKLPAYVIEGFARAGVTGTMHVTDQCPTPVEVSRWYANARGWEVTTSTGDFRRYAGTGHDVIMAHNFLNFFEPEERSSIARTWHDALVPGGAVVFVNAYRPEGPQLRRKYDPDEAEQLVRRTLEAHAASPHADLIAPDVLAAELREFAERRIRRSFQSLAEITDTLEAGGLVIESILDTPVPSAPENGRAETRGRVFLVARRPLATSAPTR